MDNSWYYVWLQVLQAKQELAQALPWGLGEAGMSLGMEALRVVTFCMAIYCLQKGLYALFGVKV